MPITESEPPLVRAGRTGAAANDLPASWNERSSLPTTLPRLQAASEVLPRVSVVIPTLGRAALAVRAARSALAQGFEGFEVVVVIDGPDPETRETLHRLRDERLHVVQLAEQVGGSEARNIGVRFARGNWVALLDDDDEWLPGKLQKQWEWGAAAVGPYALVACRFLERTVQADRVLPLRMPESGEILSEYLFARRGWQSGEGFLQTSTWFASRALMIKVPFTRGLKRCQDLDWLLHAAALPGMEIRVVPDVLAVFHHEDDRGRVSRAADWRFLYRWALANRHYFTRRAFSFFLATFCVPSAAKEKDGAASFFFLLRACIMLGDASGRCLLLFFIFWCTPESRRRGLRARYESFQRSLTRRLQGISRNRLVRRAAS